MRKHLFTIAIATAIATFAAIIAAPAQTAKADGTVYHTADDYTVIPDQYNTGADEEYLTKAELPGDYDGLYIALGGDGSAVINFAKAQNAGLGGNITIYNVDFSDQRVYTSHNDAFVDDVTITFVNCKFRKFNNSQSATKAHFVFDHCTLMQYQGSDASFYNCQFRGDCFDGINPFDNIYVESCYFFDKSHAETEENIGKHTDGTQLYGTEEGTVSNIKFNNCRFEMMQLSCGTSITRVNACIMLQTQYGNAEDISFTDCHINGGGFSVYCWNKTDYTSISNVTFTNISAGSHRKYGVVYPMSVKTVDYSDIKDTSRLYVASVWKDYGETHISVSNDTNVIRTILVVTNNGETTYEIAACPDYDNVPSYYTFSDFPFDIDINVGYDVDWVVCYDITNGNYEQIRYVNFSDKKLLSVNGIASEEMKTREDEYTTNNDNYEESDSVVENVVLTEGTCGKNIEWTLVDGILYINGEGAMYNYHSAKTAPWFDYASEIYGIEISEGITAIGNQAFRKLVNVSYVVIPEGVTTLGNNAFIGCTSLSVIELPSTISTIGKYCFNNTNLSEVVYNGFDWDSISIGANNGNLTSFDF